MYANNSYSMPEESDLELALKRRSTKQRSTKKTATILLQIGSPVRKVGKVSSKRRKEPRRGADKHSKHPYNNNSL